MANLQFHRIGHEVVEIAARIARALTGRGHRAINPPLAFPMDMSTFPNRSWIVAHKRVAQAAQLGTMALQRNLIHPRFGSFVLLGTVLTDAEVSQAPAALTKNPASTASSAWSPASWEPSSLAAASASPPARTTTTASS